MITFKFAIDHDFSNYLREANKLVRIAFNLAKKQGVDVQEITRRIKSDYNYDREVINAAMVEYCAVDGKGLADSCEERNQKNFDFWLAKSLAGILQGKNYA